MLRICCLAVLIATAGCAQPRRLVLTPQARETIDFYYDRLDVEFAVCAIGEVRSGAVVIEGFQMTPIRFASEHNVQIVRCPTKNILGSIHAHLKAKECELSVPMDVGAFLNSDHQFSFVYCGGGRVAWSTRKQAEKALTDFYLDIFR